MYCRAQATSMQRVKTSLPHLRVSGRQQQQQTLQAQQEWKQNQTQYG